jgi:hypothetical protein
MEDEQETARPAAGSFHPSAFMHSFGGQETMKVEVEDLPLAG